MFNLRPFTTACAVAATGFIAEGVITIVHPVGDHNWGITADALNFAFVLGILAMAVALPYVGRWLAVNRLGRAAVSTFQLGCLAMTVETVTSVAHGGNTLGAVFLGGVLLATIGLLVLGITGLLSGAVRWAAMLPFAGWVISIAAGEMGGAIVLALLLVVLAASVMRTRDTSRPRAMVV
jgi:hypothetical protein